MWRYKLAFVLGNMVYEFPLFKMRLSGVNGSDTGPDCALLSIEQAAFRSIIKAFSRN